MSEPQQRPLLPTTSREIATAAAGGLLLGFMALWLLNYIGQIVPIAPWSLPGIFVTLSVVAVVYARRLATRVREQRGSITPDEGVRALVLGKVMLIGGALLVGMHVAYVIEFLPRWSVPAPQQRVVRGLVTIVAATLFAAAGWLLERACITGGSDADDDQSASR